MPAIRAWAAAGGVTVCLAALGACASTPAPRLTLEATFPIGGTTLSSAVLTPDGNDRYIVNAPPPGGELDLSTGPGNTGGNLREVIWPTTAPATHDGQACATWTAATDGSQQGLAFRIVNTAAFTTAVTVTKNVEFGADWVFNVHTWDSSEPAEPFTLLDHFDMQNVVENNGNLRPLPWRACGRVVGETLQFKLWFPKTMREPSWTDPLYTRKTTKLPTYPNAPGKVGWYVGHIPPHGTVSYTDLQTWSIKAATG